VRTPHTYYPSNQALSTVFTVFNKGIRHIPVYCFCINKHAKGSSACSEAARNMIIRGDADDKRHTSGYRLQQKHSKNSFHPALEYKLIYHNFVRSAG